MEKSRSLLEQAYNRSSDLGIRRESLLRCGINAIKSFKVTVAADQPMLAERLSDAKEILEKMNGRARRNKYDGLESSTLNRSKVTLFSRRLENITDQFPDLHTL